MTLHATRAGESITIHGNTGIDIEVRHSQLHYVKITEHYQHMKYFWGQLGKLLEEAEKPPEEDS